MPTLALTPGCPSGIGPEIFADALLKAKLPIDTRLVWCASPALFLKYAPSAKRNGNNIVWGNHTIQCEMADKDDASLHAKPGAPDSQALAMQLRFLDIAIALAKANQVQGIVTGPIRKAALSNVNGVRFDGQTEYLHHFLASDKDPPLMCFAGADFLLGLATIHVPLKDVSARITGPLIESQLRRLRQGAKSFFRLKVEPNLAVLGLNPHAGEGGLIGQEEMQTIVPALEALRQEGFSIEGPLAADGFFSNLATQPAAHHAVLAMFHDQGLGPYKLLCKGVGVNMTIGLRVPRTSPAHGTADSLAGTHQASSASLIRALEVCAQCDSYI